MTDKTVDIDGNELKVGDMVERITALNIPQSALLVNVGEKERVVRVEKNFIYLSYRGNFRANEFRKIENGNENV